MTGRVHEATGPMRRGFACALIRALSGPVLWIQQEGASDILYPPGLAACLDVGRLVIARTKGLIPTLQSTEEALRSGAAPLVVAELPTAPDLTASRRLQLAAGTGGVRGLCLVPQRGLCTNAAETRWLCVVKPGGGQRWESVKNKRGRIYTLQVRWDEEARCFVKEADVEPA